MSDLISIIVPIYNSENDLEQCIESIVNQTYKDLEIILVNDGSTDSSFSICKKWQLLDKRIKVIDKSNGGLASARNAGVDIATGEYVGFVDSDDYIEHDMYKVMISDLHNYDADIVMCNHNVIIEDENKGTTYEGYDSFLISREDLIKRMLKYEKIFCSSVWSKLYKRVLLEDEKFVDEIVEGEDYYFNGRLYPLINKFYYDSMPLYNYRVRTGSMSRKGVNNYFFDKYKVAERLAHYYEVNGFGAKEDFDVFKYCTAYEILYRLYIYDGTKQQKKEWRKRVIALAKELKHSSIKDFLKVFMMKHLTYIYVKCSSKKILNK